MHTAEIAPTHYLGHLGLPSYPQPAVGPKFKRGAKFVLTPNFKQARPICSKNSKTGAPQTENGSPLAPPPPSDTPFILRGRQNYLSTSRETPASSFNHPIPPINCRPLRHAVADTPTSSSTATAPQRPPRLVVEVEAELSIPEPFQPRRPAPHRCRSNFATIHYTGVVPAMPSFAASDLLPLRRQTATTIQSTIWPWVRPRLHPPPKHRFPR